MLLHRMTTANGQSQPCRICIGFVLKDKAREMHCTLSEHLHGPVLKLQENSGSNTSMHRNAIDTQRCSTGLECDQSFIAEHAARPSSPYRGARSAACTTNI